MNNAETIARFRKFIADKDAGGWESRAEEFAAVQGLYDLLVNEARLKVIRRTTRGSDSAELDVTLDPEMSALLNRIFEIEGALKGKEA